MLFAIAKILFSNVMVEIFNILAVLLIPKPSLVKVIMSLFVLVLQAL